MEKERQLMIVLWEEVLLMNYKRENLLRAVYDGVGYNIKFILDIIYIFIRILVLKFQHWE